MKHIFIAAILCSSSTIFALRPTMDFTGDGKVGLEDFAIFAEQWLDSGGLSVPDIVWVYISDTGVGMRGETGSTIYYGGFSGRMAKHETTNAQYCQYLNAALNSGDITVNNDTVYGARGLNRGWDFVGQIYYDLNGAGCSGNSITNGGAARINYNGTLFFVDKGYTTHPVTHVSWYGATAFCNYYGWRLPTEWEWQAVADFDGTYTYGCGNTMSGNANYYYSVNDAGTTPVGWWEYGVNGFGYGMCDMAGNAIEWTSTVIESDYRMFRGGGWDGMNYNCTVWHRSEFGLPDITTCLLGFRACR